MLSRLASRDFLPLLVLYIGCTKPNPNYCEKAGDCTGKRISNLT
jgi:hypothetical protein